VRVLAAATGVLIVCSALVSAAALVVPPPGVPPSEVLDRYLNGLAEQETKTRDMTMDVEIDAKLPKLKKSGVLRALRRVTRLGEIAYSYPRYMGDKMIYKDVIARYLAAETQAANTHRQGKQDGKSMSITPDNYKFKYKGMGDSDGRWVYIFEVIPKKKRLGLYRGELWVDAATFLPVRESGRFVKNPSIFLRKIEFVRDYTIWGQVSIPTKVVSQIYTRIVGPAELYIQFSNISFANEKAQALACPGGW